MNYLSIDTSSKLLSLTFYYNLEYSTLEKEGVIEHTKFLSSMCSDLVKDKISSIDFIALAIGPGSYSGLKVGCTFAKGLSFTLNKPIIPISTFEGMNFSLKNKKKYFISLYSHREYAFFQLYDSGKSIEDCKCDTIENMKKYDIYGYGFNDLLNSDRFFNLKPSSLNIGKIASKNYNKFVENDIDNINPLYLSMKAV